MSDDIVLCDDKRCFNEQLIKDLNTLIDEQALEIQKLNTLVNNICAAGIVTGKQCRHSFKPHVFH